MRERKPTTVYEIDLGTLRTLPAASDLSTAQVTRWQDDSPVFVYQESLSRCDLQKATYADARVTREDALEGRIFDPSRELRWFRDTNAQFRCTLIEESPDPKHEITRGPLAQTEPEQWKVRTTPALRLEVPYYLIGTCKNENGRLTIREARYRAQPFHYGIDEAGDGERPYIVVHEYHPTKPSSGGTIDAARTPWPDEPDGVNRLLNQPRVLAHRFARVDTAPVR